MKSSRKGFFVFVLIAVLTFLSGISGALSKSEEAEQKADAAEIARMIFGGAKEFDQRKIDHDYVAVLHVEGVIQKEGYTYNQKWILDTIDFLKSDRKNQGIMLLIDSPGGTVFESDETYLALMNYKTSTGKPVHAYFGSLAASGGYYIASSADHITANRNTLTGSIGVIAGQSVDATGLLEKIGIKSRTFTAGRNKNMLNYNEPLSEEQAEIMQSVADDAYEQFTQIVATARKMPVERVKELADGRIYTAAQALKNGLVDEIGSLEDAEDSMEDEIGMCEFEEFRYEYEESFRDLLRGVSTFVKNPAAVSPFGLNYLAR